MNDIKTLTSIWIEATELSRQGKPNYDLDWAIFGVSDLLHKNHHELWEFIQAVLQADISDSVLDSLGAGPLEDLITYYGTQYLDEIIEKSRTNLKLKKCMRSVWLDKNDCSRYNEFYAAAGCLPPF